MTTERLFEIAEKNNIEIIQTELPRTESCSLFADKTYYIGLDSSLFGINEKIHLAHEVGHCVTGSMYNIYAPLDNRAKHELRADRWAIKKLVPFNDLRTAIKKGIRECWELAEFFNVTDEFMNNALKFYFNQGVLPKLFD